MKILSVLGAIFLGLIIGYGSACFLKANAGNQSKSPSIAIAVSSPVPMSEKITVKDNSASRELRHNKLTSLPDKKTIVATKEIPAPKPPFIVVTDQSSDPLTIKTGSTDKRIDISLSRQRIEVFEDDKLVFSGLVSAALGGKILPVGDGSDKPHNHIGTWPIFKKEVFYRSRAYDCNMHYCLFFCQGHAIHASQPSDIGKLGTAASHGCIRVHPDLAKQLYKWADIGTIVTVH